MNDIGTPRQHLWLLALPAYQLALPFTQEAWHQLEFSHTLAGPTS